MLTPKRSTGFVVILLTSMLMPYLPACGGLANRAQSSWSKPNVSLRRLGSQAEFASQLSGRTTPLLFWHRKRTSQTSPACVYMALWPSYWKAYELQSSPFNRQVKAFDTPNVRLLHRAMNASGSTTLSDVYWQICVSQEITRRRLVDKCQSVFDQANIRST